MYIYMKVLNCNLFSFAEQIVPIPSTYVYIWLKLQRTGFANRMRKLLFRFVVNFVTK